MRVLSFSIEAAKKSREQRAARDGMTDANTDRDALAVLAARIARYRAPRAPERKGLLGRLGPGLITGASDDDSPPTRRPARSSGTRCAG
jgi:hypothetical protein